MLATPTRFVTYLCLAALGTGCGVPAARGADSPYAGWTNGPSASPDYFPIAVWLQSPHNAERFAAVGVNLFIGLWQGPTAGQLAALKAANMQVICHQNDLALTDPNNDIIVAWMHGDEPDNAQPDGQGGYGPPILPETIIADYKTIAERDPSRPVLLNLGQGVAWDGWYGRGVRTNHPEDYPEYVQGADIVSYDIYPVVHDHPDVAGKLEYVPNGVKRLKGWAREDQPIWCCIETGHIGNAEVKPTAEQIRSEVWMAIIAGARGLVYFSHQFAPTFSEAAMLEDPDIVAGITELNAQVMSLAPVINGDDLEPYVNQETEDPERVVQWLAKQGPDAPHLFVSNNSAEDRAVSFRLLEGDWQQAVVLGEDRVVPIVDGVLSDDFAGYGVHLYRFE